eukprot:6087831-Ditylum_brightwellii.AAC.1
MSQTIKWLWKFQHKVDKVVGGHFFKFTAKLWQPQEANPTKDSKYNKLSIPEWDVWKERKNRTIKYVSKESCHCKEVSKAIPEADNCVIPGTHCCTGNIKAPPSMNTNNWGVPHKGGGVPGEAGASARGKRESKDDRRTFFVLDHTSMACRLQMIYKSVGENPWGPDFQ